MVPIPTFVTKADGDDATMASATRVRSFLEFILHDGTLSFNFVKRVDDDGARVWLLRN